MEQKQEKERVFELEQDRRRILEQKEAWEKRGTTGDVMAEVSTKSPVDNKNYNNPGNLKKSSIVGLPDILFP